MANQRDLPVEAKPYASSPVFTSSTTPDRLFSAHESATGSMTTVPDKLLDVHDLKAGTWGLLNVTAGHVSYFLAGQNTPASVVEAGNTHVILPEEKHYIEISDDAVFFIEFYRTPKQ